MKNLQMRIDEGRQYRNIQDFRAEDNDSEKMIVEGYASTFNEEYELYSYNDDGINYRFYEKVDPHAFDECDMSDVIMQYDHEGRVLARTRNNTLQITTDEHGLKVRADLSKSALGRGLYEDIKNGIVDRMSFGFTITGDTNGKEHTDDGMKFLRTITKVGKLYDVSAVSFPANEGTEISARNYINGLIDAEKAERLERAEKELRRKKLLLKVRVAKKGERHGN